MTRRRTLEEMQPDPPLTIEEADVARTLSTAQIQEIDAAVLRNVTTNWRKVAMVVGLTMQEIENGNLPQLPDVFFSQRIRDLVARGALESQGDLHRMRFSEVRTSRQ